MTQRSARRDCEFERRALVGIACVLVVLHAFLAALASGLSLPRAQADGAFAICHVGGGAGEAPVGDKPQPNVLCGLCAHAIAGAALPPSDTISPVAAESAVVEHRKLTPLRLAAVALHEGQPRAPPTMI